MYYYSLISLQPATISLYGGAPAPQRAPWLAPASIFGCGSAAVWGRLVTCGPISNRPCSGFIARTLRRFLPFPRTASVTLAVLLAAKRHSATIVRAGHHHHCVAQNVTWYCGPTLPDPWHVKVLVASSNGYVYAVGHAFFRNTSHGCAYVAQFGLLL